MLSNELKIFGKIVCYADDIQYLIIVEGDCWDVVFKQILQDDQKKLEL